MAKAFGVKSYRKNYDSAGTPQPLWTTTEGSSGHTQLVQAFRVYSVSGNAGSFAIGGSNVTINTGAATDGEPIAAGEGIEFEIEPKTSAIVTEFDLSKIYIVGTNTNDDFLVTYISKND